MRVQEPPNGRRQCGCPGVKPSEMRNTWPRVVAEDHIAIEQDVGNI